MVLGFGLAYAGVGHLSTNRFEFRAQVPTLLKDYADLVVLASGVVEIILGLGGGLSLSLSLCSVSFYSSGKGGWVSFYR